MENIAEININQDNSMLDSLLAEIEAEEIKELALEDSNKPTFKIENKGQAEYFIRKYKEYEEQNEEINKTADQYIKNLIHKANQWREKELTKNNNSMEYISYLLEEYAKTQLEGSKSKTIKMIEGSIGYHKQQLKWDYDEDKVIRYLEKIKADEFLEPVLPKLNKVNLKKAGAVENGIFRLNGEAVPGIVITQRPDKFKIR